MKNNQLTVAGRGGKKLKILYVITQGHWGGAQRYVFDLSQYLKNEADIEVAVGDEPNMELQQKLAGAGIKIHQLKYLKRSINPVFDLLGVRELYKLFKQGNYQTIHLNSSKAGAVGATAAALIPKTKRPKIIYTAHGWVFVEPLSKLRLALYKFIEKITAKWKDVIICVSKMSKDDALQAGVGKPEQLIIIPISLDKNALEFLPPPIARQELGRLANVTISSQEIILITIANYYGTKGLDILLTALRSVVNKLPNVHSIIIGDGPLKDSLLALQKNLNLQNNVHFIGAVPGAHKLLRGADIFILPSRKEGLPYVILEAMAAGLPIIATEVGAVPSVLGNGKAGLMVPPGAPGDLTKAIISLINDDQLKQKLIQVTLGLKGKNNSLPEMVKATIGLY